MSNRYDSIILHFIVRILLIPFTLIFAIYVLIHGEASPGGGFQAGAIFAAAALLGRLTLGQQQSSDRYPTALLVVVASIGLVIYAGTGVVSMFAGANYLDYDALPVLWFNDVASHIRSARAIGIFIIEIGVFLGVFSILTVLYDHLSERE